MNTSKNLSITNTINKAHNLSNQFEYSTAVESDDNHSVLIIKPDAKDKEYLINLVHEVHEITQLSLDSSYGFTCSMLDLIGSSSAETIDELEDEKSNIESDIYTSDLTSWLNESNTHVSYLSDALEEYETKNGEELISYAQYLAKSEVFSIVLDYIINN